MNKLLINNVLIAEVSHYDLNKPLYKILFDDGKPSEQNAYSDEDLKEQLKEFYIKHRHEDGYYNSFVYNSDGDDISESQFITEMIGEILEECD